MVTNATWTKAPSGNNPKSGFSEELRSILFAYAAVFFFFVGMFLGRSLVRTTMLEHRIDLVHAEKELEQVVSDLGRSVRSDLKGESLLSLERKKFRSDIISGWEAIPKPFRRFCFKDILKATERIRAIANEAPDSLTEGEEN